jgi:5-methyltetrahydropteroyltriglutamate--homocysteine methyltransferase
MRRSADRIITTHVGSLPRPEPLLDRMKGGERGPEMDFAVAGAVGAIVDQQVTHGVDVVTDGEQGKTGFFAYIGERLTGFEPRPGARGEVWSAEISAFPEYYAEYFRRAMVGGSGRRACRSRAPTRATSTSTTSGRRCGSPATACCCPG